MRRGESASPPSPSLNVASGHSPSPFCIPHDQTFPDDETTHVWNKPQSTETKNTFPGSSVTISGQGESLVVPRPSCPLLPRPKLQHTL
ncbi:hypothetical protein HanXRQr2_Chr02g0085171 [Helianthus annuus]|uniref:Uncharacterized protein n=1 Tax=Helianthus annuus TaxID=4232 RepID=A0A9K3P125_HELAN|nr:hypothetical protein HanXRQr2_Chr02g0085171 [Helianthus annuus]